MKELVFDIETNGLLDVITTIHCLTIVDVETNELYTFHNSDQLDRSGTLLEGLTLLAKAEVIIGHNIINFDIPAIQKIYPQFNNSFKKYHDTFILSQMLYPNEMQMHGLEAWGRVIGIAKPEHEDWSKLTEEMLVRNKEDVKINTVIWNKFKAEIQNPMWDKAVALEYKVYETYTKHQTYWYIDVPKLQKYIKLLSRLYNIYERYILSQAPMQVIKSETVVNPLKKDGMFSSKAFKTLIPPPTAVCLLPP
jgi:DNA polymerase III alpha subunit (gram-positive type)